MALLRDPATAPRPIVDCWELTLATREIAERRGLRVGPGRRGTGVTIAGTPVDPPATDAVLWRRCTTPEGGRNWLEGERAPAAPWASRAGLAPVACGYVYPDPDVPDAWYATRHPRADGCGQDRGPFPTRRAACLSLLGGRSVLPPPRSSDHPLDEGEIVADRARDRAHEAMLRAPMPWELVDEARRAGDGWEALRRAWPEIACLPLEPVPVRQAVGRILLIGQFARVDPEAAEDDASGLLETLMELLRAWVAERDAGAAPAAVTGSARVLLGRWTRRAAGLSRRVWSEPERGAWYQLEERHLALQVGRLTAIAGTAIAALLGPYRDSLGGGREIALASAGAFALHVTLLVVPLRRAGLLRLTVDTSLIVDAAWVTLAALASEGSGSPLLGLYALAVMAATLVYSTRTGIKAAILASLGILGITWYDGGGVWTTLSATELVALWILVAIAGGGARIGQRELRRGTERLAVLQGAGSDLLGISDPAELEATAQTAAERLLPGWTASLRRGAAPDRPRLGRDGDQAIIAVPVTDGTTAIGVIECRRPRRAGRPRESVRARDLDGLQALGAALGTALSRAELLDALATASATDSLTGLANRRSFDAELARALAGLRRHGRPVSLCVVDMDRFKLYNDTHGYLEGDRALVEVAGALGQAIRGSDVSARYGGEEFALLLPDTDSEAAFHVAQRVRAATALMSARRGPVTVSIGVATASEACLPEQLVAAADDALDAAKAGGRNRVEVAETPFGPGD